MKRLAFALLAGCVDNTIAVSPVIDVPANDGASAFPLDALILAVAHAGNDTDISSQSFKPTGELDLPGIPFGDDLVIHMTGRVGSGDNAYGRTCTITVDRDVAPPTPHLYFSRSVKFGDLSLSVQPEPRALARGIIDKDGAGLVFGGVDPMDANTPVTDVERFDPRTGELRLLATVEPRLGAVAAALGAGGDARIVLIGGEDPTSHAGAQFIELIEPDAPSTRRYERVDDAQMARMDLTATALTDGRVIAIGGVPVAGGAPADAVDEITIVDGTATVRVLRAQLAHPRSKHTSTRLGDDVGEPVLVTGGIDGAGVPIGTAELFKPLNESFSTAFTANAMVVPRYAHQAVRMPDGSVLIIGGIDASGQGVDTLELFTLDAGFVSVGKLPINAGLVDVAATALPDGRVLLTGGRRSVGGDALDTAWIARLDPIDGSVDVIPTDHMSVPRAGHAATLLCDGTVLVTGGTALAAVAERYNPPATGRR